MLTPKLLYTNIVSLLGSDQRKRSATNAVYSVADYVVTPIIVIVSTPFLVSHLGIEVYGILMIATSVAGTFGVVSMGLGDATIKYVSSYRAKNDEDGIVRVVRSTLTIYTFLGILVAALCLFAAPVITNHVFHINSEHRSMAVSGIRLAGLGVAFRSIDSVFLSTLKGLERYDLATKVAVGVRITSFGLMMLLVWNGFGLFGVLLANIIIGLLGTVAQATLCRSHIPSLTFLPTFDRNGWKEVASFGIYSWAQGMGSIVFGQADRLLIGSLLGTKAVAYYSVCTNLAQQVHSLVAAGFSFVFPLMSAWSTKKEIAALSHVYRRLLSMNFVASTLLALPLLAFGHQILSLWMGSEFASETTTMLMLLTIAFFVLSINVTPHYTLLGLGEARFVALTNLLGGVLLIVGIAVLVPIIGVNGAAVGRLLYGPMVSLNFRRVARLLS